MKRTLTVLFRRDPSLDRESDRVRFEGYQPFWPSGEPVSVGLNAFCLHGQRLLGLGKYLNGRLEGLIHMICLPQDDPEAPIHRLPGHRVRRFFLERTGRVGRIHFMNGTPTAVVFDLDRDDWRVLHFFGLLGLADGQRSWFDLAATPAEGRSHDKPRTRLAAAQP